MSCVYGLIGEKLGHSLSPQIHSLILKKLGKKGSYNLFEVEPENLISLVRDLRKIGVLGVNVTIPYKVEIIKYITDLSKEAEKIGAINTIHFKNEKIIGYNTDYYGFVESLVRADITSKNKVVVILGTGGASKAVLHHFIDNGAKEIIYVSRSLKIIEKDIKVISYEELNKFKKGDIIVNCTPCGMYPEVKSSPVGKDILSKFSTAVDLIYNPENTLFLTYAKELSLKTTNGLYMLVAQAIAAEEIWNETKISKKISEEVYREIKKFIG